MDGGVEFRFDLLGSLAAIGGGDPDEGVDEVVPQRLAIEGEAAAGEGRRRQVMEPALIDGHQPGERRLEGELGMEAVGGEVDIGVSGDQVGLEDADHGIELLGVLRLLGRIALLGGIGSGDLLQRLGQRLAIEADRQVMLAGRDRLHRQRHGRGADDQDAAEAGDDRSAVRQLDGLVGAGDGGGRDLAAQGLEDGLRHRPGIDLEEEVGLRVAILVQVVGDGEDLQVGAHQRADDGDGIEAHLLLEIRDLLIELAAQARQCRAGPDLVVWAGVPVVEQARAVGDGDVDDRRPGLGSGEHRHRSGNHADDQGEEATFHGLISEEYRDPPDLRLDTRRK